MNRSAVLHIPMSQYAFAEAEDIFTVRIRVAKGDLDSCTLFYGDRACMQSPVVFTETEMKVCWQDELYDYFEKTITGSPKRICYYFRLCKGDEWAYYYADAFHTQLPDMVMEDGFVVEGRSEYYQYPYVLREEILKEPEWFLNAVVYNIFPDSFADDYRSVSNLGNEITGTDGQKYRSKRGGTINGILQNLDYIEDLGFNCLYLNPVFAAGEYHKYDIVDYYNIDPCMGTKEDFRKLTEEVHKRGMHIIIDGVFNHCSWHFPFFEDVILKGEKSEYADWFYDLRFPVERPKNQGEVPPYACFAYEPKMPKLNTSNQKVQEYFAQVGKYWIEQFHVDGWRLDVANEVDRNFWRTFRKAVKEANPEAVLIGEVWENAENWLKGDMFDSVMNYDFRKHCRDYFAMGRTAASGFADSMTDMLLRYPIQISRGQLNLLDSHDVARFLSLCSGDQGKWMAAFAYLCMAPGVPSVFYGDEKLIQGVKEDEYRSPMPWDKEKTETEAFVRKVIQIRKDWIAPTDAWKVLEKDDSRNLFVLERQGTHVIRAVFHMGEGFINTEEYYKDGNVLLALQTKGSMLGENGVQIILLN